MRESSRLDNRRQTGRTATLAAAVLAGLVWAAPAASAGQETGWLGDGSGVHGDQHPPMTWNADTGRNILWKAKMPNWSNGSPVVSAGRVYVVSEPVEFSPLLTCLDADTGRELWQRELDATALLPPDTREGARKLAKEMYRWKRDMVELWSEMFELYMANRERFDGYTPPADLRKQWDGYLRRVSALKVEFDRFHTGAGGYRSEFKVPRHGEIDSKIRKLNDLGLRWSYWDAFGTWAGLTYATPATDGRRVYTVTGHNLYSCHDANGHLVWARRFAPARREHLTESQKKRVTDAQGRCRWPYGWPGQGHFSTSPVLADGRLLSQAGSWIRCLDAETGKTLWAHPLRGCIGQNMTVPRVVDLGGTKVVIVGTGEQRPGPDGDDVFRLSDGTILGQVPGTTSAKMSVDGPVMLGDVVYHYSGHWRDRTIHATRLSLDADGMLKTEKLWSAKKNDLRKFSLWRATAHEGRLYHGPVEIDARTGKVLVDRRPAARKRYCWRSGLIVGDAYLSIDHAGGEFVFRDRKSGKEIARSTLPLNPSGGHSEKRKRQETNGPKWEILGAAVPMPWKDRLYIRTMDFVYCIGRTAAASEK